MAGTATAGTAAAAGNTRQVLYMFPEEGYVEVLVLEITGSSLTGSALTDAYNCGNNQVNGSSVIGVSGIVNSSGDVDLQFYGIEGCLKAVEIHLAAGQESLQEVDPALLQVLRDRGLGLGWEPFAVHASRLSPDARTDIRAGPAPGPGTHLQFAMARTRSRYDPRDCHPDLRPTARVSAELPLALIEEIERRGATSPAVATCRWSSTLR